jgi:ABC-type Fe3+/spermidine/putrescine transport system ATPase subunit
MSSVELRSVRKTYSAVEAIRRVDLEINDGEFLTILGASGSGKTTCLRIIAGFVSPTEGSVFFDRNDVTEIPSYRRNVGMVFQSYALFPHLSASKNVGYGLRVRGLRGNELKLRIEEALSLVQLESFADRLPHELSGGQRQRVALARAVAIRPDILLLDEPLSALDLGLRHDLRIGIKRIQQQLKLTTLLVTHDQSEALSMSDRIAVMAHGEMVQVDTPAQIYRHPRNLAVAKFVGRINLLEAVVVLKLDASLQVKLLDDERIVVDVARKLGDPYKVGDVCWLGVRPEDVAATSQSNRALELRIASREYFGDGWLIDCATRSGRNFMVQMAARDDVPPIGSSIWAHWSSRFSFLLPADSVPTSST